MQICRMLGRIGTHTDATKLRKLFSVTSALEQIARNEHAALLDEQKFVNQDANFQGKFEERAGSRGHLKSWPSLTRHAFHLS